jgi:hypothetical protein
MRAAFKYDRTDLAAFAVRHGWSFSKPEDIDAIDSKYEILKCLYDNNWLDRIRNYRLGCKVNYDLLICKAIENDSMMCLDLIQKNDPIFDCLSECSLDMYRRMIEENKLAKLENVNRHHLPCVNHGTNGCLIIKDIIAGKTPANDDDYYENEEYHF